MTPTRPVLALFVAAGLALAACSGGGGEAADTTTPAATTEPPAPTAAATTPPPTTPPPTLPPSTIAPITTTTIPDVLRMPLTGVPVADAAEIPDRPAMAVKIENSPAARPQSGLNEADIVFEEIINGGITRFAAVFHSQDVDPVGPIRSGRYPDIQILEAFDRPLYVWSGGNGGVTYYIERSQLTDLSFLHTSGYYRRAGRKAPSDLYTSTEAMWEKTPDDYSIPPGVFEYLRPGEVLNADGAATSIDIQMETISVHWEYDPDTAKYYRSQDGEPHDTENSGQVSTDNLIVMMANYLQSPIDADTPDAQMLGTNTVYIFTGGTVRTGVWLRWQPTDRYAFYDNLEDLNELRIQPGRSFVELPRAVEGTVTWS